MLYFYSKLYLHLHTLVQAHLIVSHANLAPLVLLCACMLLVVAAMVVRCCCCHYFYFYFCPSLHFVCSVPFTFVSFHSRLFAICFFFFRTQRRTFHFPIHFAPFRYKYSNNWNKNIISSSSSSSIQYWIEWFRVGNTQVMERVCECVTVYIVFVCMCVRNRACYSTYKYETVFYRATIDTARCALLLALLCVLSIENVQCTNVFTRQLSYSMIIVSSGERKIYLEKGKKTKEKKNYPNTISIPHPHFSVY